MSNIQLEQAKYKEMLNDLLFKEMYKDKLDEYNKEIVLLQARNSEQAKYKEILNNFLLEEIRTKEKKQAGILATKNVVLSKNNNL
jgi:hypothetical protein